MKEQYLKFRKDTIVIKELPEEAYLLSNMSHIVYDNYNHNIKKLGTSEDVAKYINKNVDKNIVFIGSEEMLTCILETIITNDLEIKVNDFEYIVNKIKKLANNIELYRIDNKELLFNHNIDENKFNKLNYIFITVRYNGVINWDLINKIRSIVSAIKIKDVSLEIKDI